MIAIVNNFFHKALFEENKKYIILFIILYMIVADSIVCIFYTLSDSWDKIFSSKKEICQKIETDITNIVGNSEDILSVDLSEFEKRLFNVNFEYNTSNDINIINLNYSKESVSAKIEQTDKGIEISVSKDANIWIEMLMLFLLIPLLLFCIVILIIAVKFGFF